MKGNNKKVFQLLIALIFLCIFQCSEKEENHLYVPPASTKVTHPNDKYLYENEGKSLFEKYGSTVRWRWEDNFSGPFRGATPIQKDLVIPVTRLFEHLWIAPYVKGAENDLEGEQFIDTALPLEIAYVGSPLLNYEGFPAQAAHAEGSTRIVFYLLNHVFSGLNHDSDIDVAKRIISTAHHEFTHTVEARYGTPVGFALISPRYVGAAQISNDEAIQLGMVSAYGATSPSEDLAELVSVFLMRTPHEFKRGYVDQSKLIKQKIDLVIEFYRDAIGIDLIKVRASVLARLADYERTKQIPD